MKSFIFTNAGRSSSKEYKTDFITGMGNFTVHDIKVWGAVTDEEWITLGVNYLQEPHSIQEFKAKATALNLVLVEEDFQAGTNTELVAETTALALTTAALTEGIEGVAELVTATIDSFANSAQGDYMILNNKAGDSFAIWLDLDADGTVPTGSLFLATTYQIMAGVVTGDSAIVAAGKVKAAIELDVNWVGFDTITDVGDGTLEITNTALGTVTAATVHNAAEDGAGSIGVAILPEGAGDYSLQLASEGGVAPYTYELDSTSDALVAGLTLSGSGLISGVATTTGTPDIVIKVTDSFGQSAISDPLTLTITS